MNALFLFWGGCGVDLLQINDGANRHDMKLVKQTLEGLKGNVVGCFLSFKNDILAIWVGFCYTTDRPMKGNLMLNSLRKLIMKNKSTLFAGVLAGIASPTTIYVNAKYPRLHGTDTERLRHDVVRIGNDFNKMINQEYAKEQITTHQKYPAA